MPHKTVILEVARGGLSAATRRYCDRFNAPGPLSVSLSLRIATASYLLSRPILVEASNEKASLKHLAVGLNLSARVSNPKFLVLLEKPSVLVSDVHMARYGKKIHFRAAI